MRTFSRSCLACVFVLGCSGSTTGGTGGTGGISGTGGNARDGGNAGKGGNAGTIGVGTAGAVSAGGAPPGPTQCTPPSIGSVTLQMLPPANSTTAYCVSCDFPWLTIYQGLNALPIQQPCGTRDCSSCGQIGCPTIACVPSVLGQDGLTFEWNGTQFATDVCNGGAPCTVGTLCQTPIGDYKASLCAIKALSVTADSCTPDPNARRTCVEVDFTLPTLTNPVVATLP